MSNLAEFLAGTDPTSAASRPGITGTAYNPQNGLTASFPALAGRTYQLEYKNALTDAARHVQRRRHDVQRPLFVHRPVR